MNPQLDEHKKQAIQHLLEGMPQLAGGSAAANVKNKGNPFRINVPKTEISTIIVGGEGNWERRDLCIQSTTLSDIKSRLKIRKKT